MKPLVPLALAALLAVSSGAAVAEPGGHAADLPQRPERATVATAAPDDAANAVPVRVKHAVSAEHQPRDPAHLRLWKFDAPVIPVQLRGSELVPPDDPSVLGWWGQPAGSARGTTLLVGHTVHTGGGMLDDLEDTPVGDIANVSGVRYRVASVKVITKPELAQRATQLFAQTGRPKLVMVTCEGYNRHTGLYADNVVVTATPL